MRRAADGDSPQTEVLDTMLPGTSPMLPLQRNRTVNRHRWVGREYQGALENSGEETRQIGTVTSGEGATVLVKDLLRKLRSVEDTRPLQLFIKNTALCKHESGRIGCDACPVPEG